MAGLAAAADMLDPAVEPWQRATPERLRSFGAHLIAQVAPRTAASSLIGLKVVLKAMHPEGDWRWLMDLTNRLNSWAAPAVDRSAQTLPIEQIHNACLRELDRLLETPLTRRLDRVAYRDTLIALMLSAAPVRLRNLAAIEIGTQLRITARGATLPFSEHETKNRQPLVHPLPRHLVPYLQALSRPRPPELPAGRGLPSALARLRGRAADGALHLRPDHPRHRPSPRRGDQPAQLPRLRRHQPRRPLVGRRPPRRAAARPSLLLHHRAALHPRPTARGEPQGSCYARRDPHQPWPKAITMTRAAIYARYSSDLQREASIEDQVRLCASSPRARAGRSHTATTPIGRFRGARLIRPGYPGAARDAMAGRFDVVLAEALDRLCRDQEDIAALYKRLRFAGVQIVTLSEGEICELHIGLKGTMSALYLKDLADKTRRGLRGRVEAGRSGGGNCYGYDVVRTRRPTASLSTRRAPDQFAGAGHRHPAHLRGLLPRASRRRRSRPP